MRGGGSCSSGDRGPGHWLCTGWMLWTCVAQPWEGPGTRVSGVHKSGLRRRGQSPGSHCRLPSTLHGPLQECTTSDTGLCHLRSVPCFPWCVLWERRGNSSPHSGLHTWVAAGTTSHPCQLCPWSSPPGPSHAVPPAWESAWEVLGQGSSWGGYACQGWGSLCPYPPMQHQTLMLKCYL